MQKYKLKELQEIGIELKEIISKKIETIKEQKYEVAVSYRAREKELIERVNKIVDIKDIDFQDDKILNTVKKELSEVIYFIEDEDSNLTPALIRKLVNDKNKAKKEIESLKEQIEGILKKH